VDWEQDFFFDTWMYRESPERVAYDLLRNLDLGPKLKAKHAVGHLRLEEEFNMLGTYWNVEAADDITLSLLQERLNQLNTGVKIIMP